MAPMEYNPMEKTLWPQWNMTSWSIAPMETAWFYEDSFLKW